ncbi:MAG: uracil-xanthine permease family protein [Eubacteriales bacterium]
MNLIYKVKDRPKFGQMVVFAFQQLLAILAATIAVPAIVGHGMSQSAALFGAGVGTIVYLLFTKFKSPVFLGSSFAFLGSMSAAFAGAATVNAGYAGLLIGATFAGLIYVVIALIVKFAGVKWISKLMPAVVIGPTVAIIGLSLAGNAIGDALHGAAWDSIKGAYIMTTSVWINLICALVTLFTVIICSVYGKKMAKLIPFIIGIVAGYLVATVFTVIGNISGNDALVIIDFSLFNDMKWIPDFTFIKAFKGFADITGKDIATVAVAYIPVAFVVFAEHIADHKNLSSIIETELLEDPGLDKTLLGDGVGSIAGAFFGGCPNTTYGESVGCVAITGNASVVTIFTTAIMAILISFFGPFVTFLATIPACVMGGVCITLYGFIAVSGLKMIQKVDLGQNRNLFVVSVILIAGVGSMALNIGQVVLTEVAVALILGIIVNLVLNRGKSAEDEKTEESEKVEK